MQEVAEDNKMTEKLEATTEDEPNTSITNPLTENDPTSTDDPAASPPKKKKENEPYVHLLFYFLVEYLFVLSSLLFLVFKSKRNYPSFTHRKLLRFFSPKKRALLRFGGPEVMHATEATLTLTITPCGCL